MVSLNSTEIKLTTSFVGIFTKSWLRFSCKTRRKFKTSTHTGQYFVTYTRHYILNNDGLEMLHRIPYQSIYYTLMDKHDNAFAMHLTMTRFYSFKKKKKNLYVRFTHCQFLSLFQEFFSIDSGGHVPEIEGPLYLKSEGKKAWKRFYFVLRASGIYYNPKGKSKVKELNNFTRKFNHNEFTVPSNVQNSAPSRNFG